MRTACALIIWPIKCYQYIISPFLGPCCRYYPSCSDYAIQTIGEYGVFKGLWLAIKRILRCHPWSRGGYDPAPSKYLDHHINMKNKH